MAARHDYQAPAVTDDGQRYCARAEWCAASTRDAEGNWHPALTWQPYCGACTGKIVTCLTELPPLYALLTSGPAALARATGRVRVPPGPRIPVSAAADALAREAAAVLGGWAARVRAVPGLDLSAPRHPPGTPQRVREDCAVMARHHVPLMALPDGWTTRGYDLPGTLAAAAGGIPGAGLRWLLPDGGTPVPLNRATGSCRKCGRAVTRSAASGWWWAPGDGAGFCDHDPGPVPQPAPAGPVPADLEADIGDLEIVSAGDTWVKVMRLRSAVHAGEEILRLHWHARRLTGQVPAQPDLLDGMPCRSCEAMSSLAVLERPPPDPAKPPPPWCRCADCGDEMTRAELTAWAVMYAAWVAGAGVLTCRRCDMRPDLARHPECCWAGCTCCGGGPRRAAA